MSRTVFCSEIKASLVPEGDKNGTWIEFAKTGTWKGYREGAFSLTDETLSQMVANFNSETNPRPTYCGHPDVMGLPEEPPAVGWIRELKAEKGKLFGFVEFLSDFADRIREGAYRYCSIVANLAANDRETNKPIGARLQSLGITNTPFIDGLAPIALSEAKSGGTIYLSPDMENPETQPSDEQLKSEAALSAILSALGELAGKEVSAEEAVGMIRDGLLKKEEKKEDEEAPSPADEEAVKAASAVAKANSEQAASLSAQLEESRETIAALTEELTKYKDAELGLSVEQELKTRKMPLAAKDDLIAYAKVAGKAKLIGLLDRMGPGLPSKPLVTVSLSETVDSTAQPELNPVAAKALEAWRRQNPKKN